MPWIRITIKLKSKTLTNVREEVVSNIEVLQNKYYQLAANTYGSDLLDCEVGIISKTSSVVLGILEAKKKRLSKSIDMDEDITNFTHQKTDNNRKVKKDNGTMGERMG